MMLKFFQNGTNLVCAVHLHTLVCTHQCAWQYTTPSEQVQILKCVHLCKSHYELEGCSQLVVGIRGPEGLVDDPLPPAVRRPQQLTARLSVQ